MICKGDNIIQIIEISMNDCSAAAHSLDFFCYAQRAISMMAVVEDYVCSFSGKFVRDFAADPNI
ncbi:MAG: hypothetical protein BGO25_03830 [Acidobacteriales bacterium 59-55]|nr:MAG: hypothetical protein BGO25_03830 [Acidobacteriales bacterium 59-55]